MSRTVFTDRYVETNDEAGNPLIMDLLDEYIESRVCGAFDNISESSKTLFCNSKFVETSWLLFLGDDRNGNDQGKANSVNYRYDVVNVDSVDN